MVDANKKLKTNYTSISENTNTKNQEEATTTKLNGEINEKKDASFIKNTLQTNINESSDEEALQSGLVKCSTKDKVEIKDGEKSTKNTKQASLFDTLKDLNSSDDSEQKLGESVKEKDKNLDRDNLSNKASKKEINLNQNPENISKTVQEENEEKRVFKIVNKQLLKI